jgi:hypothetical protein
LHFDPARGGTGSALYKRLVAANKADWDAATTKEDKRRIARKKIYDVILANEGRFLVRAEPGRRRRTGPWVVQGERESLAKIMRALKDYVDPEARAAAEAARLGRRRLGRRVDGPPGPSDVIRARGGLVNFHRGNALFRAVCLYCADRYASYPPERQAHLIRTLIRCWKEHGGRFLVAHQGDLFEDGNDAEIRRSVRRRLLRPKKEEEGVGEVEGPPHGPEQGAVEERHGAEQTDEDEDGATVVAVAVAAFDGTHGLLLWQRGRIHEIAAPPPPAAAAADDLDLDDDDGGLEHLGNGGGVVNEVAAQPAAARALPDEGRGRIDESDDFATSRFQPASPRLPSGHGFRQQHGADDDDDDGDRKLVREDVRPTDPTCPR